MYFYGYRQHQPHAFVNKLKHNVTFLLNDIIHHISIINLSVFGVIISSVLYVCIHTFDPHCDIPVVLCSWCNQLVIVSYYSYRSECCN